MCEHEEDQFGSKLGLLQGLVADLSESGGVAEIVGAALDENGIVHVVRGFVQGTCEFWEREYPVTPAGLIAADTTTLGSTLVWSCRPSSSVQGCTR